MVFQWLYELFMTVIFFVACNSPSIFQSTSGTCKPHTIHEVIAGINYMHHDRYSKQKEIEEKIFIFKELQRQHLAPKVNLIGLLNEYETLKKLIEAEKKSWTHVAQDRWPELYPECGGKRQSPIQLSKPTSPMMGKPPFIWKNYNILHANLQLKVSAHSVDASANWTQIPTLSGGPLIGEYKLAGIHWHWGMDNTGGSEHTVPHCKYVLEMHAVHYSTKYKNADEALVSGDEEAIAVVGIFFGLSSTSNPGMANVVNILRNGPSPSNYLLLSDFRLGDYARYYYTYLGSLTVPPCYEVVRWIVMDFPEPITESELDVFRNLFYNGTRIGSIYRNPQPTNGRRVEYTWS